MLKFCILSSPFIFCFLGVVSASGADDSAPIKSLYSYSAESLDHFSNVNLSDLEGQKSIWILFQPECKSCEAQLKDLSCIPKSVRKVAIGFWGNRQQLQKVVRPSNLIDMRLIGTKELERAIGLKQTPTLLVVDQNGSIKETATTKTDCKTLNKKLERYQ